MAENQITCPSGLAGTIRSFKGKELKLLGNRRDARSGAVIGNILGSCWLKTSEPGPYEVPASGRLVWDKVLLADRFFTLLRIRTTTYPDDLYTFRLSCPTCREPIEWEIDLDTLPVKPVPEASLEQMKAGEPFEATLNGTVVKFVLANGETEKRAAKFIKGQEIDVLPAIASRIVDIDGVDSAKRIAWLEDLDFPDILSLRDQFDEVDGGVETGIDVECTDCGRTIPVELPLGEDFFTPRKLRRKGAA